MVHKDRAHYNMADLTISAYNVTQETLSTLHQLVLSDNDDLCLSCARTLATLVHPSSQSYILQAMTLKPAQSIPLIAFAGCFKTEGMLSQFTDRLGSENDSRVQVALIDSIGHFEMSSALQALRLFATNKDDDLRIAVARALAFQLQAKEEAEDILQELLEDVNRDVVTQCLVSLKSVGTTNIISKIEFTLENHQDAYVKSAALSALGALSSSASVEIIKRYLADSDTRVRASAVEALGVHLQTMPEMLRDLMPFLKDESNRVIANAVISLYPYARDEATLALQKLARSPLKYHRSSAAYCIGELQYPDVMNIVLPLINTEPERDVFERALNAIGRISKANLKPFLHKLSEHPNNELREKVVQRLAVISTVDDSRFFYDLFQKEHVITVKAEILRTIGHINDEQSFSLLLESINNTNPELCIAALQGISYTNRESTIPLIMPLMKSKNDEIRLAAISSLFRLGVLDVTSNIVAEMKSLDANVVINAVKTTEKLFSTIANLKKEKPEHLMAALLDHFSSLQSSDIENERTKLDKPVTSTATDRKDYSQTSEIQFAELLSKILPLSPNETSPLLEKYARQHPRDILSNYLNIVVNDGVGSGNLSKEMTQTFKTEKFMPGLFASLESIKENGDRTELIDHYLEMASSQIRIMLEFVNRAKTYVNKNDDSKAGKMLDFLFHYLKLSPDIHNSFGAFYLTQKDYDLALEHLFKAYVKDPRNYDLLLKIAGAAVRQGKYSLATELTTVVTSKTPVETDIWKRASGLAAVISKIKEGIEPSKNIGKTPAAIHDGEVKGPEPISLTLSQETAIVELSDEDMLFDDM